MQNFSIPIITQKKVARLLSLRKNLLKSITLAYSGSLVPSSFSVPTESNMKFNQLQ